MSSSNGVIRIGRKGIKKFVFGDGDEGTPFDVDIVSAFQQWAEIDDSFREEDAERGGRRIPISRVPEFHAAARHWVHGMCGVEVTTAEALDFAARVREQYEELADFFVPKSKEEQDSPATSEVGLQFSEEAPPPGAEAPPPT